MRQAASRSLLRSGILLGGCSERPRRRRATIAPPAAPRGLFSVTGDSAVTLRLAREHRGRRGRLPRLHVDLRGRARAARTTVIGAHRGHHVHTWSPASPNGDHALLRGRGGRRGRQRERPDLRRRLRHARGRRASGSSLNNCLVDSHARRLRLLGLRGRAPTDARTDGHLLRRRRAACATMFAPFTDTDIQDAGYATTPRRRGLRPGPAAGRPTGTVELIAGPLLRGVDPRQPLRQVPGHPVSHGAAVVARLGLPGRRRATASCSARGRPAGRTPRCAATGRAAAG